MFLSSKKQKTNNEIEMYKLFGDMAWLVCVFVNNFIFEVDSFFVLKKINDENKMSTATTTTT